jgi:hypothetical protein
MSSCFFKNDDIFLLHENNNNQLKQLIIPKGTNIPPKDKEYYIPYTQKDFNKKSHDIFPPI